MERINLVELLRNCPSGMELDCTIYEDVVFHDIVDRHYSIRVRRKQGGLINLNAYGCMDDKIDSKCVIFPKGKTTWEEFQRPFVDGDILSYQCTGYRNRTIYIYRHHHTMNTSYYVALCGDDLELMVSRKEGYALSGYNTTARFATEEEKGKLFDAIKANGYRWDAETKTLEKLNQPKFKDGDILYCNANDDGEDKDMFKYIFIFDKIVDGRFYYSHCHLFGNKFYETKVNLVHDYPVRFATEEEKQKLFQAIKDNGYKWNSETKTLEKLIKLNFKVGNKIRNIKTGQIHTVTGTYGSNKSISFQVDNCGYAISHEFQDEYELVPDKFDINTLVPFESRVLVRDNDKEKWHPGIWGYYDSDCQDYPYKLIGDISRCCIPYEGNEHLRGKTEDCNEYFKTWEKIGN